MWLFALCIWLLTAVCIATPVIIACISAVASSTPAACAESVRERELSERRQRLGLPEPKKCVSITGPREGLPPAPDDGDDGNGGWISGYEEVLRAVMRDLRVHSAAKKLHGGGVCARVFTGSTAGCRQKEVCILLAYLLLYH